MKLYQCNYVYDLFPLCTQGSTSCKLTRLQIASLASDTVCGLCTAVFFHSGRGGGGASSACSEFSESLLLILNHKATDYSNKVTDCTSSGKEGS